MTQKKKVIFVTDGDASAKRALEHVTESIGGTCISSIGENNERLPYHELCDLITNAKREPVIVLFDDCGYQMEGLGERAMRYVATQENIEVIGAIAVASTTHYSEWTRVDVSIDRFGNLTEYGVDKDGLPDIELGRIDGDTVSILDQLNIPIIVGIGDIGKMAGHDAIEKGAPITKMVIQLILERSE